MFTNFVIILNRCNYNCSQTALEIMASKGHYRYKNKISTQIIYRAVNSKYQHKFIETIYLHQLGALLPEII